MPAILLQTKLYRPTLRPGLAPRRRLAVVVMAHVKHRATRRDLQVRLAWKLDLTKALYRRGYDRTQVIALYRFLDWVITLPEELARAYVDAMDEFEKEQKMAYLSYAERLAQGKGFEQGIECGVHAGRVQSIVRQLQRLFRSVGGG